MLNSTAGIEPFILMMPSETTMTRPARTRLLLLAAILVAGAGATAVVLWPKPDRTTPTDDPTGDGPSPDPRLTFDTPFRNVKPEVAYVGDAVCAPCHKDIDHSFHKHAMGRSATLAAADGVEKFDAAARPTFTAFGRVEYRVERRGDRLMQVESIPGPTDQPPTVTETEVAIAIGSGTRGRSYLCGREGSLWQTGPSWFSEKQIWDVSPGFVAGRHGQRPVTAGCLFCHVNQATHISGSTNRFAEPFVGKQAAIGCERCHGPGSLHVAEQRAGTGPTKGLDTSIVNPKHLSHELREDVCRQCHFQGADRVVRRGRHTWDYRPGLPLDLFLTVFVRHPSVADYHKSVGQVEQMSISKCATSGKLGCTSCHDPHGSPAAAEMGAYYRAKCQTCHDATKDCRLPIAEREPKKNACAVCHMPDAASSSIAHTAVTDHRILREPAAMSGQPGQLPAGALPLVAGSNAAGQAPSGPELERDLGLSLMQFLLAKPGAPSALTEAVLIRLTEAVARHPSDAAAWESIGRYRFSQGDWPAALLAAEASVRADPKRESALSLAASVALRRRQFPAAREFAGRASAVNPGAPSHQVLLAEILLESREFAKAEAAARASLKLAANSLDGRLALAVALYQQGQARAALAEVDRAAALDPARAAEIRADFQSRIQ